MRRLLLAGGVIGLGVAFAILPALSQSGSAAQDSATAAPGTIRTVATGFGAQSGSAFAVGLDKTGDVYVAVGNSSQTSANSAADPTANRILIIQSNGTLQPFAGSGAAGSLGDGGPAIAAQFSLANISSLSMQLVDLVSGENSGGQAASSSALQTASGIAVTAAGDPCVADTNNATIRCIGGLAPNAIVGSVAGRWGPASNVQLVAPTALAADVNGNLYISDPGANAVLKLSGQTLTTLAQVVAPGAIAVNAQGTRIFVASPSNGGVLEIDPSSNNSASVAAIRTVARIVTPSGLAIDPAGNLFISDAQANVIRRMNVSSAASAASNNNMAIIAGTGTAGNSGDGGAATSAQLNTPGNLALDQKGNLFVADEGNHSVRELAQVAQAASSGVTLSPTGVAFGDQVVGGTSGAQTLTLANNSSAVVAISGFSFTGTNAGDFSQTNNCGSSLSVGANCSIFVTFTPQVSGAQSGTLQVTDSDPSSPQTAALTGTGDDFELSSPDGNLNPTETVLLGQVVPFNLQVTSDGTFSGPVTIQCPAGMPDLMTCALSPATVNVTPGKAAPFTITLGAVANLNSNVSSSVIPARLSGPTKSGPNKPDLMLIGIVLGILAIVLLCDSRIFGAQSLTLGQSSAVIDAEPRASRIRRLRFACATACMLLAIGIAPGCSNPYGLTSSSNKTTSTSSTPPAPSPTATPTGSYMLDVIGSSQNAARSITITINVVK